MKTLTRIYGLPGRVFAKIQSSLPPREPALVGKRTIPVAAPDLGPREKKYLLQALASTWISAAGDDVELFEQAFRRTISQTKYAIAVNSGTAALEVAFAALGIGPGDEVILPTFTMIATVNAVWHVGGIPVLVDADPVSWNMDLEQVARRVTARTKAVIAVHIYGAPVAMDKIKAIARRHHLWLIEDAAEAHGAEYQGTRVGGLGDVAAFSLYANKIITTGEGGMVTTNNAAIAKRVRLLSNHAFSPQRHFWHSMRAYSLRMSNLQAAVGLAQVERFSTFLRKKREHASLYRHLLASTPGLSLPEEQPGTRHSFWVYGVLVNKQKFGLDRNQLREVLAKHGVETRSFFIPIHWQPAYGQMFEGQHYPVAERLCADGYYLPSSTVLSRREIEYICKIIKAAGSLPK